MDFKLKEIKIFLFKILIIIILFFTFCVYLRSKRINFEIVDSCEQIIIDYELKNLDDCLITVHNFIRMSDNCSNGEKNMNDFDFKSYISTYTKPYLIQLLNNNSKNCLCCEE